MELANSPAMQSYCTDAAILLRSLADESFSERQASTHDNISGQRKTDNDVDIRKKDSFIRPFHADIDDRNLYKTKVLQNILLIYNLYILKRLRYDAA